MGAFATAALVVLLTLAPAAPATGATAGTTSATAAAIVAAPLEVTIESLSPSTVPQRGQVTITGEVVNRSDSTWTDLNVYMFASAEPMTTSAELAEATATDPELEVGDRVGTDDERLSDRIEELAPGQSAAYVVSVPQRVLQMRAEGVYWVGVHVLGTNEDGRAPGADARARTFISRVAGDSPRTTVSLVLPVKGPVRRGGDGTVANDLAWSRMLSPDGRLGRLLSLSGTAAGSDAGGAGPGGAPGDLTGRAALTWVVDPAVLDAVRSLARGNPGLDTGPTRGPDAEPTESPGPTDGESPPASPGPSDGESEDPADGDAADPDQEAASEEDQQTAELAADWLAEFTRQSTQHAVMRVPYGDVDTAAMLRGEFTGLFERAVELAGNTMESLGVPAVPVVAPASGLLPQAALDQLGTEAPLLLSEQAAPTRGATVVRTAGGHRAALASQVARVGGPGPTAPYDALTMRQVILAQAAVHALGPRADQPLVVTFPEDWNPGTSWRSASFFAGLDVAWLDTSGLPAALAGATAVGYPRALEYPRAEKRRELPVTNLVTTQELNRAGSVLANLLTRNDTIDEQVSKAALLASSTAARQSPRRSVDLAERMSEQVHDQLDKVTVQASQLVTMSSGTGSFAVTVVNGLDQPVTVGMEVSTGTKDLRVTPPDLVSLGPGQRASVRLGVTATGTGVHQVQITPTTRDGRSLSDPTEVKVRSSQVGLVIWLVMGGGAAVFVIAIAVRILRRVRNRKKTHGPLLKDAPT